MTASHLDEEQVQRLLHGELLESEVPMRDHLGECAACRSRIAMAEREERRVLDLLQHLDHSAQSVDLEVMTFARRRPLNGPLVRWAAGILLTLAAGSAVYAAPGSPLRAWVERFTGANGASEKRSVNPVTPNVDPLRGADDVVQGIAVDPGDGFTIEFAAAQDGSAAVVSLTDATEIVVRAVGAAATFTSDLNRIVVAGAARTARFEIEIPRRAPRVEIRVGDRRAFLKNGATIVAASAPTADGRYTVRLSSGRPSGSR